MISALTLFDDIKDITEDEISVTGEDIKVAE
jgi:hypothetical protein